MFFDIGVDFFFFVLEFVKFNVFLNWLDVNLIDFVKVDVVEYMKFVFFEGK